VTNVVDDVDDASVLVVCTANQCRSPLGAAFLRVRLAERAPRVRVASVGIRAVADLPATESTIAAAAARRVDLSAHRTRRIEAAQVSAADLVIGMERGHVQEAVLLDPSALTRSFTLKELARRARAAGRRGYREPLAAYTARLAAGRQLTDLLGSSREDDLDDPTSNRMIDHDSAAAEIDDLVAVVVEAVWNPLGLD
jgi:protein-tyrosine phosphatase